MAESPKFPRLMGVDEVEHDGDSAVGQRRSTERISSFP